MTLENEQRVDHHESQLPPPMPKFSRDSVIFGTCVMSMVIGRHAYANANQLLVLGIDTLIFFWLERKTSMVIFKILHTSEYLGVVPTFLIKWGLATALCGGLATYISLQQPTDSILNVFFVCYMLSTGIFSFASALASLIVGTGIVNTTAIRRGFFAIYLNLIIIIRTVYVSRYWLDYIKAFPKLTRMLYVSVKIPQMIFLIRELYNGYRIFIQNKELLWPDSTKQRPIKCVMCYDDDAVEPKNFRCSHDFCYACAFHWYAKHDTCPHCRDDTTPRPLVAELAHGKLPFWAFFCAL